VASEIMRFELVAGVRKAELDDLQAFFSSLAWALSMRRSAELLGRSRIATVGATVASTMPTT
jgi:hypothetical protein